MPSLMRAAACFLAHLGTIFWIGCSSSAISNPLDAEVQLAKALCQRQVDCGEISPSEQAACEQAADDQRNHPPIPDYAEAVAAGRAGFDGSRAAACIDDVKRAVCAQTLSAEASCLHALSPQVADGGTCKNSFECRGSIPMAAPRTH